MSSRPRKQLTGLLLTFASILIALTALCFGGAARAAAPEPSPTPPPLRASGLIAFKHLENFYEGEEIFTVNPDGTGRAKLIGLYGRQEDPAWSPDGKYIAYASGHRGYGEIWRADADGSNQISLSDGVAVRAVDDWPAWSPDGEKIVFVRNRQLWTIGRDGGTAVKLSTGSDEDEQPSWSPDGTKIAFVRDYSSATAQIWVMDADGSNQRNLSNYEWGFSRYPAWSPDGSRIAFQRWNDIWVMDADGSNQTQLTFAASGGYLKPAWSPDGSRLVVTNGINFEGEIFVMNADGSGITKIADGVHPTWQSLPPLTLTAADSPGRVTPGAELTYTLEVTNNHTLTAAGATLTDALDAGATFVLAETTRGSCATPAAGETGTVTCSLGDLAEGDRATVRVVVRVAAADGATLRNAATASAGYAGYGRQSQSAETATRVFTPPADLSVYAWINGGAYVSAGGQVVYGVSVFNSGPATAAGVTLTASLPEGVTLDTIDDAGGGECASEAGGRGFTCTFASVGVYEGRDLRVKATSNVAGEPYMPVTAAFNVAAATPDVTPDNNASTAAFFIAAPPLPAPTPGAADEALLAYGKQPLSDGQYDLYRQRADGTGTVKLTDDANYEDRFTWSPDGSRLAFLRHHFEDGFVSLGTVAADGSGLRMLTSVPGEYIVSVSWSPDGSRLVFDATPYTTNVGDPYVADVFVINADGTGRANLTNGDGFNSDPSWSPDGTRVAYTRGALAVGDGAPSGEIRVAGADGSGLVRIPQAAGEYDFTPHWSPDGARLAFTRRLADGTSYVQTVGADGTGPRRLTERPATDEANPQWSPDGSKVLFDSYDRAAGVPKIEVINADGSGRTTLHEPPAGGASYESGYAKWSPDGSRLVVEVCDGGCLSSWLYVIGADGSGRVDLGSRAEHNDYADWSPDGTRLAFTTNRNGAHRINIINADGTGRVELPGGEPAFFYGAPRWRPRPGSDTPVGSNVSVAENGVAVTFSDVTAAGVTTVTPIDPNSLQGVPGEYVIGAGSLAFEIHTTAAYAGPITIGFQVPGIDDPGTFGALRVLHGEPAPNFVDRTVLAPDSPAPDFATRTVYARVTSLSPFVVAQLKVTYGVVALYDQTKAHRSGSIVPIKLQLTNAAGANVSSAGLAVKALGTTRISTNAAGALEDAGSSNPDFDFRYNTGVGGYVFNLKTTGYAPGTYALAFRVAGDPVTHTVQFRITK